MKFIFESAISIIMELLKNHQKILKNFVRDQLEFYFSDRNLKEDIYLSKLIKEHEFVPLFVLMTLDRIRKITLDMGIILDAISESKLLQMNEDSSKVKRIKSYDKSPTRENLLRTWFKRIRKMIESHFDDYYLSENPQLFKLIERDSQGFVKLEYFKCQDYMMDEIEGTKLIAAALSNSNILEVSIDGTRVRRTRYPFSPGKKDSRIIIVKNLSKEMSGTKVKNIFEQYGKITEVRFFKSKDGIKKDCSIEFFHPESVLKACEKFQDEKTDDVSIKDGVRNNAGSKPSTSEGISIEAEEATDPDTVYYITKSFENLETAEIEDTEDQLLENGKRRILNETEPSSKRVCLDEDSSFIENIKQDTDLDERTTSGPGWATKMRNLSSRDLQIEVLPMAEWKKMQINKLHSHFSFVHKSKEQLEGFGEKIHGNEEEHSKNPVMEPEISN